MNWRPRPTGPGPHDTVISDETWAFDQEVAGGAAVLVDPFDVEDIARGIDEALSRRDELSIWGLRQAARRHWSETARLTASAYREVMR